MLVTDQDYPRGYGRPDKIYYIIMHPGAHPICVCMVDGDLAKWWFYSSARREQDVCGFDRQPLTPRQRAQVLAFDLNSKENPVYLSH